MISKPQITQFFSSGPIALIGVSRNPKKFGYMVLKTLADKKKYELCPVNPNADEIYGFKCYKSIGDLPETCKTFHLMTAKASTASAVKSALEKGATSIWIQQGTDTPEALQVARDAKINLIHGKCIMMFADPTGMHRFHRNIMKFFGRLPK